MECGVGNKHYSIPYIVYIYNCKQHNGVVSPESYQFNHFSSLSTVIIAIITGTLRRVDHVEWILVKTQEIHGEFQLGSLQNR